MTPSPTLHIDSLSYRRNNKVILSAIYLAINQCGITVIKGRNGAGKSTLLHILFGAIKADFSYMKINGTIISNRRKLNTYFSYKPQRIFFPKWMSVKDAVAAKEIENTTLSKHINTKISELSTGEQLLIQTLYTLNLPQPICLLDEPFAGLSPLFQSFLGTVIEEKAKHKIIILTDHSTVLADEISNATYLLQDGVLSPI